MPVETWGSARASVSSAMRRVSASEAKNVESTPYTSDNRVKTREVTGRVSFSSWLR